MREVALDRNQAAIDFANRVITGGIDVVIFMTGVGTRILVQQVERHVDRARFLAAVSDIKSVVRGPKPLGGAQGTRHHADDYGAGAEHVARDTQHAR